MLTYFLRRVVKRMLVYLVNIFAVCVWAMVFCTGKKTVLKRTVFVVLCFAQCVAIAGFRYGIGSDYGMYAAGFFNMARTGFEELTYEDWEIGYILLNKIVGIFTAWPSALIMVSTVISLIGPFYLIWRYSTGPFMSVFLYLNMYLFYLDMNYIRQAIAMSILCFAFGFLRDKKFWRFLLIVAVAATFHLTVLYMIPVFVVALVKITPSSMMLYLFGLLFYYILSDGILNILLSKFHTEYAGSVFIESGVFFYYALFPILLCLGMVALSLYVKEIPRSLNVLIHMTLMMGFWQVVMTKHSLFERFSYYTMLFVILAVPEALKAFKHRLRENLKEKYLKEMGSGAEESRALARRVTNTTAVVMFIVTTAVVLLAFAYNMVGLIVPDAGVHGVLPYQTQNRINIPNIDGFFKG